jgi:hypothetical protein
MRIPRCHIPEDSCLQLEALNIVSNRGTVRTVLTTARLQNVTQYVAQDTTNSGIRRDQSPPPTLTLARRKTQLENKYNSRASAFIIVTLPRH